MIGLWNNEWQSLNAQRRYPLADDVTGVDQSGSFTLPNDFLCSLDLPIHAGNDVDPGRFFIQTVAAFATGYSLSVGYQPTVGDAVPVANALIPRQSFTKFSVFRLGGGTNFEDATGKVVIGHLDNIDNQPAGFWTFDFAATRLDPDAIRPILRGISSITCVTGTESSAPLYGDIVIQVGANMQITPILAAGEDPTLVFSAINGEGTVEACVCNGDAAPADPILTIDGITPAADGNFEVIGSNCIQVEPITNGVRLVDTCAAPCCGCQELEKITSELERLSQQAVTVNAFVDRLSTEVNTMDLIVLGSRIGGRGSCAPCA